MIYLQNGKEVIKTKKNVGIISLYYNNANYGGLLQSYALVTALNKLDFQAKQISFDSSKDKSPLHMTVGEKIKTDIVKYISRHLYAKLQNIKYQICNRKKAEQIKPYIDERSKSMMEFAIQIDHTDVFSCETINSANEFFDAFICGSDQVWNPSYLREAYLLTFAAENKTKVAYAASIGRDVLSENELIYLCDKIKGFDGISVRELSAKTMLENKLSDKVEWVLDPTLLLTSDEWDSVEERYPIKGEYMLAYFLGGDKKLRQATKKFAKKKGMQLISFPHILGKYKREDDGFGDIAIYDADPLQFVSLIKNASYILTDSFHACVFSIIYQKKFVVFERQVDDTTLKMNSRINSLLKMTNLSSQIIDLDAFCDIGEIDYSGLSELENMRDRSYRFLLSGLLSDRE